MDAPIAESPLTPTVWVILGPLWFTLACVCLVTLLGATTLRPMLQSLLVRYASRNQDAWVDAALAYVPEIVTVPQLLLAGGLGAALVASGLWVAGMPWWALLISPGLLIAVVVALLRLAEWRYVGQLDAALPAAVARLQTLLGSSHGFQPALRRLVLDLPPASPLRREWAWVVDRLGARCAGGRLATAPDVVAALALQTPSARQRQWLLQLETALTQPHDALLRRIGAAADALAQADRRRSAARTALAQLRYSGILISGSGLSLTLYLALFMPAQFKTAYGSALGHIVAPLVALALLAPILGGLLLSQVADLEY